MDYGAIATLISSGIALVTSIISIIINIYRQNHSEILQKRILPTVSILDNSINDIDSRLQYKDNTKRRIFFEKKEKNELYTYNYYYFIIHNNSEMNMTSCKVEVIFDKEKVTPHYIGTINKDNDCVIPVRIHSDYKEFKCIIFYSTERREKIEYVVDAKKDFSNRKDSYRFKRKIGYSKYYFLNDERSVSYSVPEFMDDNGFTFNMKS